jgi:hypothetical protein
MEKVAQDNKIAQKKKVLKMKKVAQDKIMSLAKLVVNFNQFIVGSLIPGDCCCW